MAMQVWCHQLGRAISSEYRTAVLEGLKIGNMPASAKDTAEETPGIQGERSPGRSGLYLADLFILWNHQEGKPQVAVALQLQPLQV